MVDTDLADFDQIHYLKISLNNMYTHNSLTISSIIMPRWAGASKNNFSISDTPINKKKLKSSIFWNAWRIFFTLLIKIEMLQGSWNAT